jgi:CBS domain-containing protein
MMQDAKNNSTSKQPGGGAVKKFPKVSEYMDERVPTLEPSMPIRTAIDYLTEQRVTGAPVVSNGDVVGMITEKDCLKVLSVCGGDCLAGCCGDCPLAKGTVKDYMSTDVVHVPPHMDVYYAAGIFLKNTFRRLLVVEDEKLVGEITRFDILRAIQAGLRG